MGFYKIAPALSVARHARAQRHRRGAGFAAGLEELPEDLKQAVESACAAENIFALGEAEWNNAIALEQLVEERGVKTSPWPQDIVSAARTAAADVIAALAAHDVMAGKIAASYESARLRQIDWSRVSAEAFLRARNG